MTKVLRLGEFAEVGAGNSAPQNEGLFKGGTLPFVRTSDVGAIHIGSIESSRDLLTPEGAKGLKLFPAGTILFPKSGASTFLNHRVILNIPTYVSSHLATIKANNGVALDRYIFYFLQTVDARDLCQDQAYPSLNRDQIAGIKVPLPSIEKQREIVEKLDSAFAEIDSLHVKQKDSAEFVNTMLQSYIDDLLLRDQDESVPLTNLAILENGDRGSNYPNKKMREVTGVPFINAGHIGEGKLDMSQMDYIAKGTFDKLSRGKIQRNDLLFCLRGSLGKTAILSDLDEGAIASSLVIVRAKDGVNPKFLLYYFLSSICKSEIEEYRSGTAQPNLGGSDLKKFLVPLHSQTRMQEIVTKMDEVASQIDSLTKNNILRNIALVQLKQSVLNSVFTFEEAVA